MGLNESIVEEAALGWFGELGYAIDHGPHLAPREQAGGMLIPAFSQRGKEEGGEVVLVGRLIEAIRRPRDTLLPKLLSGELSVAEASGSKTDHS